MIVLEEGSYYSTRDFTADSSAMIRQLYRDGGATMAIGRPPILYQEGRAVGGSTVINGGMSWRTPEKILERWEGMGLDVGKEMEPYFERVEKRIHVAPMDAARSATTTSCSRRAPTRRAGRSSATCATKRTASDRTAARLAADRRKAIGARQLRARARCTTALASTPMCASIGSRATASARPA